MERGKLLLIFGDENCTVTTSLPITCHEIASPAESNHAMELVMHTNTMAVRNGGRVACAIQISQEFQHC